MGKKFLIIDDSALMRRVISDIIKADSECEVLDFASNGVEGFDKLVSHPGYYDLVMLDINMPKMNGLEMLEMLQKNRMQESVVVVSTMAKEGAKETIRALELGALDFVTKPENFYEVKGVGFRTNMLRMIELVTGGDYNKKNLSSGANKKKSQADKDASAAKIKDSNHNEVKPAIRNDGSKGKDTAKNKRNMTKLVAMACSTGGPKALQQVIPLLPGNLDAGVVLVQHMPKGFTASLASRLNSLSQIEVSEAVDGETIKKGHVYIAPGGMHIRIEKKDGEYIIKYHDVPPIDGLKPCANIMYDSLKNADYDEITCVVMTGMGSDGTKGIKTLSEAKKPIHVISQNAESCVVYGMPRTVAEAGLSDEVKSLDEIAESIIKNVGVS